MKAKILTLIAIATLSSGCASTDKIIPNYVLLDPPKELMVPPQPLKKVAPHVDAPQPTGEANGSS